MRRRTPGSWLDVADPPWLRFGRRGSALFLLIGSVLICAWQVSYATAPQEIDRAYEKSPGLRGIYTEQLARFFYFFHYTDKFPITIAEEVVLRNNEVAARRLLSVRNRYLRNEDYTIIRAGDLGKIFLFYPDLLRVESPLDARLRTFNRMIGIGSLLCLFVSLCLLQHRMLGTLLVGLLGSNPFQLYHLYVPPENIWAYPMCVASLTLALNAPLILARKPNRAAFVLPLLSGAFLASVREVRTEPALVGAALVVAYAIAAKTGWRGRVALISIFGISASLASMGWERYWSYKIDEATKIVARAGGKTLPELSNLHHALWHPIWWGLGDLGRDKGYRSSDRSAFAWGIPRVNERFGTRYKRNPTANQLDNYHAGGFYHIKPETIPEYAVVLRDKIIYDVTSDPMWYLSILAQRTARAFRGATPIRFGVGSRFVDVPFSAWLALPVLAVVLALRRWDQVALLLFYTPTSLPTILVSSHRGFDNIASFHIVAFALVGCWGVRAVQNVLAQNLLVRKRSRDAE
jgi:hypothetical protein